MRLELVNKIREYPLYTEWENVGGQIIPSEKIQELFGLIKAKKINNWEEVHAFYKDCENAYKEHKVRHALYLLELLYSCPIEKFSTDLYRNITDDVSICATDIYTSSLQSRKKDYSDYYRNMTYRNKEEMEAVIGPLSENEFLKQLKKDTSVFINDIKIIFEGLIK